ncbi:hypothetical protein J7K24_03205 [bacterium]|nr:hypothetical protein [bacterium]
MKGFVAIQGAIERLKESPDNSLSLEELRTEITKKNLQWSNGTWSWPDDGD